MRGGPAVVPGQGCSPVPGPGASPVSPVIAAIYWEEPARSHPDSSAQTHLWKSVGLRWGGVGVTVGSVTRVEGEQTLSTQPRGLWGSPRSPSWPPRCWQRSSDSALASLHNPHVLWQWFYAEMNGLVMATSVGCTESIWK